MSKLGPTSTKLEPTATERLRALLDERGVEWDYGIAGSTTTMLSVNGIDLTFTPMRDGLVCSTILTPEQVIAATMGSCNCSNSERTDVPRLPHFWTHDGTLHVEATRMPTRIVVCEGGTCEFVPKRELDASEAENANLRERITTQKQTIQAYRDESREWREVAELAQAENAKLRELVRDMYKAFMHGNCYRWCEFKEPCNYISDGKCQWYDRMRELGVDE